MNITQVRVAALVSALALLSVACSDSQQIGGADTTDPSGTATTAAPVVSTTVVATDDTSTTIPTTVAPVPTLGPPPTAPPPSGSALGGPTNLVATPGGGITLSGEACPGFDPGIPGWHVEGCQYQPSYSDGVQVLVLRRNDDGRFGVAVLFLSGGNWVQRYFAEEPDAGIWSDVTVMVGDFHFDDGAEVWVGYRCAGTDGRLLTPTANTDTVVR